MKSAEIYLNLFSISLYFLIALKFLLISIEYATLLKDLNPLCPFLFKSLLMLWFTWLSSYVSVLWASINYKGIISIISRSLTWQIPVFSFFFNWVCTKICNSESVDWASILIPNDLASAKLGTFDAYKNILILSHELLSRMCLRSKLSSGRVFLGS